MSKEHLGIYLNDHLAGSNVALEILDHLAVEAPDLASPLAALKADVNEDRQQLLALMASLEISESRARKAGSWIAEKVAEVKLEVDDDQTGPLRRLERLEALAVGIYGKIELWQALNALSMSKPFGELNYEVLIRRGEEQRARVDVWRLQAAKTALVI